MRADVCDCLLHCILSAYCVEAGFVHIPLWIASASLSGISMLNSSSIAMTTSTVSSESNPRSFEKCAAPEIYHQVSSCSCFPLPFECTFDESCTCSYVSIIDDVCLAVVTYLVKVLQQIHDPPRDLFPRQTSRGRVASYAWDDERRSCSRILQ